MPHAAGNVTLTRTSDFGQTSTGYFAPAGIDTPVTTIRLRMVVEDSLRAEADKRFEKAMTEAGARDPRDFYRRSLRELRGENPEAYDRAVNHFQEVLVPSIARGEAEPLTAWREYGRLIAESTAKGQTVAIDENGISHPFESSTPLDQLVLHMPDAKGGRAILVSLPPNPSPAQRASYDLLVAGKHKLAQED